MIPEIGPLPSKARASWPTGATGRGRVGVMGLIR